MSAILAIKGQTPEEISEALEVKLLHKGDKMPSYEDVLIRWGSATKGPDYGTVLNSSEAILTSSDKPSCRQLLSDNGISVPKVWDGHTFPCIGRTPKHTRGRGFFWCFDHYGVLKAKELGAVYFSEFYPKQKEYRVHVGGGEIILYSKKIKEDFIEGDKPWNKKYGFYFKHLKRKLWRESIINLALDAIDVVGLDFGAVDIMADAEGDFPRAVVSEINTAPALSPYGIEKYCEYFRQYIGEDNTSWVDRGFVI